MIKDNLSTDNLLELRKQVQEFEMHSISSHQSRKGYYTTLITTVLGATIVGYTQVKEWYEILFLVFGPVFSIITCRSAKLATGRLYKRFIEFIAQKNKIDYNLGLYSVLKNEQINEAKSTYLEEPIAMVHSLKNYKNDPTAVAFTNNRLDGGYQSITNKLFSRFEILSYICIILLLITSIVKYIK